MLESKIQQKCVAHAKSIGYLCRKMDSSSSVGWPDLLLVSPTGTVLFIEVKTATGRLSKMQTRTINQLEKNHANVYVIRSVEEFKAVLNQQTT